MCAIAGWIDFRESLKDKVKIAEKMADTMLRRGPDEGGFYYSDNALLIHRRLSVVDISGGKQPMSLKWHGEDYTIIYNGELYNCEEIRSELSKLGHEFQGHSDTEVLLHAWAEWQTGCLERLNGIYAFAVWNGRQLYLVRDRMGVKPLFYYRTKDGIIFASEIKTLLSHPDIPHVIDREGLCELLLLSPGRTPGCGIFKGIKELKRGEFLRLDKDSSEIVTYWRLKAMEHTENEKETVEKVRYLTEDAIKRQLVSDVPLCCFLSGGLDSSIISAEAARLYRDKGEILHTYSVDYRDNDKYFQKSLFQPNSDGEYIKLMREFIGSYHHETVLDNELLFAALEEAVAARDLPGMADIDSSLLLFCREIKKTHTVALSGECADEIFGGYPWYHNEEILFDDCFPWSRTTDVRRAVLKKGLLPDGESYLRERYLQTVKSTEYLPTDSRLDRRMREMFMLNVDWFMQTLLDRKDRMSMYSGLEVRVPFCDHRIAEYCFNMPWKYKALHGREKGILRAAVKDLLPEEIVERKKSPYPKTHNPVFLKLGIEKMRELFSGGSLLSELFDKEEVERLAENPDMLPSPWYGQLMRVPQILAYLYQLDVWFKKYDVNIENF